MTELEPVEETWIFAGSRVGAGGKKIHAWLPTTGDDPLANGERWWNAKGGYVVGGAYTVRTSHEGDATYMHGIPVYVGKAADMVDCTPEALATLNARHIAAETRLRSLALERNAKRTSELDAALKPLL